MPASKSRWFGHLDSFSWRTVEVFAIRLAVAGVVMGLFWMAARYYNEKILASVSKRVDNPNLSKLQLQKLKRTNLVYYELGNLLYYVLLLVGFSISLSILGIGNNTILAVLGTLGLAISLSLQKYLSSIVSGVVVSTNDWFNIGDRISLQFQQQNGLEPITGRVVDFDLLRTVIYTDKEEIVSVPNDLFLSNSIYYPDIFSEQNKTGP